MICNFCYQKLSPNHSLQDKYQRALKFLKDAYESISSLEQLNQQLRQDFQTIDQAFDIFKKQSIRQYCLLRDEFQNFKNHQQTSDSKIVYESYAQAQHQIQPLHTQSLVFQQKNGLPIKEIQLQGSEISKAQQIYKQRYALMLIKLKEAENARQNLAQQILRIQTQGKRQYQCFKQSNSRLLRDLQSSLQKLYCQVRQKEQRKYQFRQQLIQISSLQQFLFRVLACVPSIYKDQNKELCSLLNQINSYLRVPK